MKARYHLLLIAAIVFVLASCQKEVSDENGTQPGGGTPTDTTTTGSNTEVGTWKFISLHTTTTITTAFTETGIPVKTITPLNYVTTGNTGTLSFDGSKMTTSGIGFSVNTNTYTYVYLSGALFDSVPYPFTATMQVPDTTVAYQKINADSLYFQAGGLISIVSGGALPATPSGCKLKFSGSTMVMTTIYDGTTTDNSQGFPAQITTHAVLEATLQKQ